MQKSWISLSITVWPAAGYQHGRMLLSRSQPVELCIMDAKYKGFTVFTFTFTFTYPIVMDRRGATGVLATNSLHSSRLSAFLKVSLSCSPVHSFILSHHLFFCLPLFLPPGTVPCSVVFKYQPCHHEQTGPRCTFILKIPS